MKIKINRTPINQGHITQTNGQSNVQDTQDAPSTYSGSTPCVKVVIQKEASTPARGRAAQKKTNSPTLRGVGAHDRIVPALADTLLRPHSRSRQHSDSPHLSSRRLHQHLPCNPHGKSLQRRRNQQDRIQPQVCRSIPRSHALRSLHQRRTPVQRLHPSQIRRPNQ